MPERRGLSRPGHMHAQTWVRGHDKRQKRVPISDEERAWILALHAERPDLRYAELARLTFREFGHDRATSTIQRICGDTNGHLGRA